MSPDDLIDQYRRTLISAGEVVSFTRPNMPASFGPVLARATEFTADDVVMDVQQGDRKIIVLTSDLVAVGFPVPLRKSDRVVWNGKTLPIKSVDDATRRVQGVSIALDIIVSGA